MKIRFLIIIGMILIGFTSNALAQYIGDKYPAGTLLDECIGGPRMCPEQQLAERLENDQKTTRVMNLIFSFPNYSQLF